jgi:cyclopropane fatty-acyl-phospholipid synthase-like methyltransferase
MKPLKSIVTPKTKKYSVEQAYEGTMGPGGIYLTDLLASKLHIKPNERLLDLGCGKVLSSCFLAKEYKALVFAFDLWVSASENYRRIKKKRLGKKVFPLHGEAHFLPFPDGYFDKIFSLDAYHYFGTDEYYLHYLLKFLKHKGLIGVAVPTFREEIDHRNVPSHIGDIYFEDDHGYGLGTFHPASWWKNHWEKTGQVKVLQAEELENGYDFWVDEMNYMLRFRMDEVNSSPDEQKMFAMVRKDKGKYLGWAIIIGMKL